MHLPIPLLLYVLDPKSSINNIILLKNIKNEFMFFNYLFLHFFIEKHKNDFAFLTKKKKKK